MYSGVQKTQVQILAGSQLFLFHIISTLQIVFHHSCNLISHCFENEYPIGDKQLSLSSRKFGEAST